MSNNLKTYALAALVLAAMPVSAAFGSDAKTYSVLHASEPPIADGQGRFYFYRSGSLFGAAMQPSVYIDGATTGARAKPGDYFYVDRPAGTYEVSTTTEKKESVSVTLAAGQSLYIRFDVSMGLLVGHVSHSIIDPQQALNEIQDCDYHPPSPDTTAPASAPPASTPPASAPPAATPPASTQPAAPAEPPPPAPK